MRPSHMITLGLVLVGALPGDRARAVQATSDNAQEPADEATDSQSRISVKEIAGSTEARTLQVFPLERMDAESAKNILTILFADKITISADAKVNTLVINGDAETLLAIGSLLAELDSLKPREVVAGTNNGPQQNAIVISIEPRAQDLPLSQLRSTYERLDKQCLEMATRLRRVADGNEGASNASEKQLLMKLVALTFQARQTLQKAELAEHARRLAKIQKTIETREQLKSQIVSRRVDELLDPNLDWNKTNTDSPVRATPSQENKNIALEGNISTPNQPSSPATELTTSAWSAAIEGRLLRKTPEEIMSNLGKIAEIVQELRTRVASFRQTLQQNADDAGATYALSQSEEALKANLRDYNYAIKEWQEIVKYLQVAADSVQARLKLAQESQAEEEKLYKKGATSRESVRASAARTRELQVELQQVESLLNLYRAAGEAGRTEKTSGALLLRLNTTLLGGGEWITGDGSITNTPHGTSLILNEESVARVRFKKIPGQPNVELTLVVQPMPGTTDALLVRGIEALESFPAINVTEKELTEVIAGRPTTRLIISDRSGKIRERLLTVELAKFDDTDSELSQDEVLIAKIDLINSAVEPQVK